MAWIQTLQSPFRMLRGLLVPAPPERNPSASSLSQEVALTREEEMIVCARVCHSRDFFPFVLSCGAPDVPSILLSGEQTEQLKGRARRASRAEVLGTASAAPFPKGLPSPLPCTPEPGRATAPLRLAVRQVAKLAWWQKGGRGLCQGLLLWFLSSLACANPPVRWKEQCAPVGQGKLRLGASAATPPPPSSLCSLFCLL